jgi:hypothetical protein
LAENSLERLVTPTALRAETRNVGPGWDATLGRAGAEDRSVHLPFSTPYDPPAALPPQPPPPAPTEQERRDALAAALEQQARADAAFCRATDAHTRAVRLIDERKQAIAGFASLEDERLAATLDSLRDDDGGTTLPAMDDRLVKREIARLDLDDAEKAAETLLHELLLMRDEAAAAARRVNMLAVAVLTHTADRLVDEHSELLRQAAAIKEQLHAFDHLSANSGASLSGKLSSLLLAEGMTALAKQRDTREWQAARAALLKDPMAEITITIGTTTPKAEPASPLMQFAPAPHDGIIDAKTGEVLTIAELTRRRRAEFDAVRDTKQPTGNGS